MRKIYLNQKTFVRYNDTQVVAYLNEEVIEGYIPEDAPKDFEPVKAYAYSGDMEDGGTLINAGNDNRDTLINGIIRSRYTQSEEDAIKTHQLMVATPIVMENSVAQQEWDERRIRYESEWKAFLVEREYAIMTVDSWSL